MFCTRQPTPAFSFSKHRQYDRARPSYPASSLQLIYKELGSKPGATVIEAGSGTGIFSRLLVAPPTPDYPTFNLKTLVAVEPSAGMRAAFDRGIAKIPADTLKASGVDVRTVDGGFDDLSQAGVAPNSADAVIIAQAWHWCPDHEKALREIAAYLKPGAPLIFIWNLEVNDDEWHKQLRETYQPLDLGSPQYYRMRWKAMFDTKAYSELFQPAQESHLPWSMGMTEDSLVDRLFSKSYLTEAHLNGDKRVEFEKKIRDIARQDNGKEWIDKDKGVFKYRYNTDVYVIRKK